MIKTDIDVGRIKPVSTGGTNDISNLRTLCQDCNIGKGAKVYTK